MSRKNKTILVVDDTETNIDVLVELLGNTYDMLVALDGETALKIVEDEKIDLIMLDIMMPNMDGYEVCSRLKNNENTKDIPVIFITARIDEDSIERAYEVGGIDYIRKPFKPRELLARVKTQIDLRCLINHLEHIASYDEMTGIYNRRKFFELATAKFEESKKDLYAVMIDIDKFKSINDLHGHAIGDEVIKIVAQTIDKYISTNAIYGRIGGEEFSIICIAQTKEIVLSRIEIIRQKIEKLEVVADDGVKIRCTISEGIAKASEETNTIDALLKEADIALYEAKDAGRNKVIFRR